MQKRNLGLDRLAAISSSEAEMLVIGCGLIKKENFVELYEHLKKEDFYKEEHQEIFECMRMFYEQDLPFELNAMRIELTNTKRLDKCGGFSYIINLMDYVGIGKDLTHYIKVVQSKSLLRKIDAFGNQCQSLVYKNTMNGSQALEEVQNMLMQITNKSPRRKVKSLKFEDMESLQANFLSTEKNDNLLSTGFSKLDFITHGLGQGKYWIIAARPAMGKTAFALNLVENIAVHQNKVALIFSLEMQYNDIIFRLLSSKSKIPFNKFITKSLSPLEYKNAEENLRSLKEKSIFVDESTSDIISLRHRARIIQGQHGLDLIIIDYLQLIRGLNRESRQIEVGEISMLLRELAKELNVTIVCLSQLSRKVEDRSKQTPVLSDLRDSGCIEQDADLVLLLNRPDYYNEKSRPNEMDLIVAKNRFGECGTVQYYFDKPIMKFSLLEKKELIAPSYGYNFD